MSVLKFVANGSHSLYKKGVAKGKTVTLAMKTWTNSQSEEDAMYQDHLYLWHHMIDLMTEKDLSDKSVLDFGCNQGGFLRHLYARRPFASGLGVDIAEASLVHAASCLRGQPIEYAHANTLFMHENSFDVAFSHEVLYLLDDLSLHAKAIKNVLKDGGAYYAAIGCHTDNPLWERWRDLISSYSNVPVQNYSLDDYAEAFFAEGFDVSARPFRLEGFVPLKRENRYFPSLSDSLDYHTRQKTLFRLSIKK